MLPHWWRIPPPDPKHQRDVEPSPPWRFIGITRVFTLAIVGLLSAAFLLDYFVAYFFGAVLPTRSSRLPIVLGLPALLAIVLLLSQRQRNRPSVFWQTEKAKRGYFRIGPYEDIPNDRKAFRRPDCEHEHVLEWLERRSGAPLYLTGDSGTGKSSLLQAFVLPNLRGKGWLVEIVRSREDPEAAARAALNAMPRRGAARQPPAGLIVLDQFEEFVVLQASAPVDALRRFRECVHEARAIHGLRLLLVLRKEYEPFIERLGLPHLRQAENWRPLGRFDIPAARSFIAESGLRLSEAEDDNEKEINRLLMSAADLDETPNLIRPVTLNILGFILSKGHGVWRDTQSADLLIRGYIRDTLRQLGNDTPRLLRPMVSEVGTRRPRQLSELAKETGIDPAIARVALVNLNNAGLARPLDTQEETWEISHDFVARLLERELHKARLSFWLKLVGREVFDSGEAQQSAEVQARVSLGNLGILVRERPEGLEFSTVGDATDDAVMQRAKSFLVLLSAKISGGVVGSRKVSDLSFLAGFTALQSFRLLGTRVSDLKSLSSLTALQSLDLLHTQVNDLSPLSSLPTLQSLRLSGTELNDLSPLSSLTTLQSLRLSGTQINDLSPLSSLTTLQSLDLSHTQINDLSPLLHLTDLQSLRLSGTPVKDIRPLSNLTALQSLELSDMQVKDVTPLSGLTALQSLDLVGTRITNVSPLANLTALEKLNLRDTQVANMPSLAGLTALQSLDLRSTQITDVSPLANLTALQSLNLRSTQITDVSPLANLTALRRLDLMDTEIADLLPLVGLTALQSMDLMGTQVTDLSSLAGLTALQSLDAGDTRISDLSKLAGLTTLQNLNLTGTWVVDVSPLVGLSALRRLNLRGTWVTDVLPLAALTALQRLNLSGTRVTDVSPLADLTALQNLDLKATRVTDVSPLRHIRNLTIEQ